MDSLNQALVECIKALGGSGKVGPKLWPERSVESAQRSLLDCLNPERTAKLSPEQVLFVLRMARAKGHHIGMEWLCDELSYAPPQPIEPKDEMAELQRQFIQSQERMADMLGRMERLQGVQHFPSLMRAA